MRNRWKTEGQTEGQKFGQTNVKSDGQRGGEKDRRTRGTQTEKWLDGIIRETNIWTSELMKKRANKQREKCKGSNVVDWL